jgi:c-di-GMP-binding flagellar brake protein YcgR
VTTPAPPVARKGPPKSSDALEKIAVKAEPHEMRDPFDIGDALTALAAAGEALTVYPARGGETLMARVHAVDPELPHFVLDFVGALPPVGAVTVVAALGGNAKLQFDLAHDWRSISGQPHLVQAEFPPVCLVLNRRAAPRLETPLGVNYSASFQILGKGYELPLYDFSLGGVGLRATPEQAIGLRVGKKLETVRLELGPALVVTADLEIRLMRPFRTFLLGDQVQIGCAFTNISMQMQQSLGNLVTTASGNRRPG